MTDTELLVAARTEAATGQVSPAMILEMIRRIGAR